MPEEESKESNTATTTAAAASIDNAKDTTAVVLPQPSNLPMNDSDDNDRESSSDASSMRHDRRCYRYLKFEQIVGELLTEDWYNKPGALCWVLTSKGKKATPQLFKRARVLSKCEGEDQKNRVTIQYPKTGSTYRARKTMLMPVLEYETNLILVASETTDYRRTAIAQTRKEDHFVEIGCDFGILVDSVDAATTIGIDKSETSINIARERYPTRKFLLGDIFDDDTIKNDIIPIIRSPLVVAIDINGNRMLPAVLKCIQLTLDKFAPRLVIVKSRELYAVLNENNEKR